MAKTTRPGTQEPEKLLNVLRAMRDGDFSVRLEPGYDGPQAEIATTLNQLLDNWQHVSDELQRVSGAVCTEGRLHEQVTVEQTRGAWGRNVRAINRILEQVNEPVSSVAEVLDAVADGDLEQRVDLNSRTGPLHGDLLRLASSVNRMADQMSGFTNEVTRVAREVGTEGKLGGRAQIEGVSGAWRDVTEAVNGMAGRLTDQVRDISRVTTAVAEGDLTRKVTVDVQGEMLSLKNTVNTMVDQLDSFADEVTRVAREVGTEGKLGGRANVKGVSGTWKDLTNNVNSMADNLTDQVRDIAQVTTAVAKGDLTKKVTVDVQGEMLSLKNTVNTMVDQLDSFADEVTRVAREVGTEGQLGGRANVKGVSGIWKDLTDNVNSMANSLTTQVRNISQVTTAVARGDLTKKITVDAQGEILELKDTVNTMVDQLSAFADEVTRVAREVGTEGQLGGQATVPGVSGVWKGLTDNVNSMADNLTRQVRQISVVTTAAARGDLTKKITVDARGEILELKETINTMVDQLSAFAAEVTRVAREVGTEGQLGGRANVMGVSGIWKDLTENVNSMSHNLTTQVRNISQVTTAVARGDLTKKITVDAQGEILELKDTVNTMVDQLSAFAAEVTRVAREVGSEGRLGGQAKVEGVSGTWKQLTDRVNELAGNLTTQVRAIGDVAGAVTRGDLTQSITVEARGELSKLRDNINLMVSNLRASTNAQQDEDWLKSHLARISGLVQGHRDLHELARLIMSEVTPLVEAHYGACYLLDGDGEDSYRLYAGYGYRPRRSQRRITPGDGLAGQVIAQRAELLLHEVPGDYVRIESGVGDAPPLSLAIFPIISDGRVLGALELASFGEFRPIHLNFLRQLVDLIGATISSILANVRTEYLLAQSQQLATELQERTNELQRQQEELREKNTELHAQAGQLANRNRAIELQNRQIERARQSLEERARQLHASYKYKSEFLANMSHELRTPLNSLLILARLLSDNPEGNLTPKQVEFSRTIHKAGTDLLQQIDGILDLSKVEAGRMEMSPGEVSIPQLVEYVEASFRALANEKGLAFTIEVAPDVPEELWTDDQRLKQVLRNLLSNSLKFTSSGEVRLRVHSAAELTDMDIAAAVNSEHTVAFSVEDTGPGIPLGQLQLIFEAFHQGDGGTSRRYGGTGLGLSISRNLARLLGGEISVSSTVDSGSIFTLVLPVRLPNELAEGADRNVEIGSPADVTDFQVNGMLSDPLVPITENQIPDTPLTGPTPALRDEQNAMLVTTHSTSIPERDGVLRGKRVLIVDDDIRNVFALTSALEAHGLRVSYAENGAAGITKLESNDDIALVLMDIMMPELDGDETTRRIREMPQFADLPIITLTAKAMRGDRERSLEHGASDYVTKPINLDHLLDVMRAWLDPSGGTEQN